MFEKGILKILKTYEAPLLLIARQNADCICLRKTSCEPDKECPYCFGTGKHVIVSEINGAIQDSNGTTTMRKASDYTITKEIFIDAIYTISPDDLLVFENSVWKAYQIKTHRLVANVPIYHLVYATPLKYDGAIIVKILKENGVI